MCSLKISSAERGAFTDVFNMLSAYLLLYGLLSNFIISKLKCLQVETDIELNAVETSDGTSLGQVSSLSQGRLI